MTVTVQDPVAGVTEAGGAVLYVSGDTKEWVDDDPASLTTPGTGFSLPRSALKAMTRPNRASANNLGPLPPLPPERGNTWSCWISTLDTPQFFGAVQALSILSQTGFLFGTAFTVYPEGGVSTTIGVLGWSANSFGNPLGDVFGTIRINDGQIHHIAVVRGRTASDESDATLYVDGVMDGYSVISNLSADGDLLQGITGDFTFTNLGPAQIAHIAVYDYPLTIEQIQAIHAAGRLNPDYYPSRYVFGDDGLWRPMISPKTVVADVGVYGDPLLKHWTGTEWYPEFPTPGFVTAVRSLRWSVEGAISTVKSLRWTVNAADPLPSSPQRAEANASWSWRSTDAWKKGYVYQGEYSVNGNYRGCWFYGSNPFPDLRGKDYTIDKVTVRMRRTSSGGDGGNSAVWCGTHNYTSKPDGQPTISDAQNVGTLAWGGETKEMTLPNSWGRDIIEGTDNRRGLGLFRDTGSPYLRTEGVDNYALDGRITIEFH